MATRKPPRLFTLAQATQLMPRVRNVVEQLRAAKRELADMRREYAALTPAMRANGFAPLAMKLARKIERGEIAVVESLAEIDSLGIEIKDVEMGLVDFPSLRDDRFVYLCWKVDEPAIGYWHELDAGLAGRQPL